MKNTKKGFTLIELITVVAIIALLSTFVVASLSSSRQKSRDAQRIQAMKQVQNALELYRSDNNSYPDVSVSGASFKSTLEGYLSPEHIDGIIDDPSNLDRAYYGTLSDLRTVVGCGTLPNSSNPPGYVLSFVTEGTLGTKVLDLYGSGGVAGGDTKCFTNR